MSSVDDAVVLPPSSSTISSSAEPTAALAQSLLSPNPSSPSQGVGRLSFSNVNQHSSEVGYRKATRLRAATSSPSPQGADVPMSEAVHSVSGEAGANLTTRAQRISSATPDAKENRRTVARTAPIVSPRGRRPGDTEWTPTAAYALQRSNDAGDTTKKEESPRSPPVVPVTVTQRIIKKESASAAETTSDTADAAPSTEKPGWSPRHVLPSAAATTAPLFSPRRRAAALHQRVDSVPEGNASPRASPREHTQAMQTEEEVEGDDAAPKALEDTVRPPSKAAPIVENSNEDPAAALSATKSFSPEPARQRSLQTVSPRTPRQRATPTPTTAAPPAEVRPAASHVAPSLSTAETNTCDAVVTTAATAASLEASKEPSPAAALATPRGLSMASRVEEIRARLAASRQQSTTTATTANTTAAAGRTPRSSLGSVVSLTAMKDQTDNTATSPAAAAAIDTIKELKDALKEKEKAIALLTRDNAKTTQLLEKATKKADEVQGRWGTEKAAFAAHKKESMSLKLDMQKELRQAQSAARAAQTAQEKLQKELEKQKEKLVAISSRATSATPTPTATPRGVPLSTGTSQVADTAEAAQLRLRLARVEKENDALKESVSELKRDREAAVAASAQEAKRQAAAELKTSLEEAETLKSEASRLTDALALREAALEIKAAEVRKLDADIHARTKAVEQEEANALLLQRQQKEERQVRHTDATTDTDGLKDAAAAPSAPQEEASHPSPPHPSPPRSPRQVVTFALSAQAATAQLQEELTATQCQVSAYKRMQEHADRRIEQLEAELTSMQHRAKEAVEALQRRIKEEKERRALDTAAPSDATALDAVKKELAKVREDCINLKRQVQETGEESVTLKCALEEAEDERDVYERQLRELQELHSKSEWATRAATERATAETSEKVAAVQELLDVAQRELTSTQDALQQKEVKLEEALAELEELRKRCDALVQREAEAKAAQRASAESLKQQVEHYKKKSKSLTKKLADANKELQVLGEEHVRVCAERDAAVLRHRTEETNRSALDGQMEGQLSDPVVGDLSLQSEGVPSDDVSRDLSDALLSAKRAASTRLGKGGPLTAALAQEQRARVQLEKEVSALHAKVAAMEHLASPMDPNTFVSDSVASLPSMDHEDAFMLPPRGVSAAPPRARSPQTTHALDLRFFDPTATATASSATVDALPSAAASSPRTTGPTSNGGHLLVRAQSRSVSQSLAASLASPSRSQRMLPLSPQHARHPVNAHARGSMLDAVYAETPLPSAFFAASADATAVPRLALLFSTTAGCLLVSKRGRQLHRPQLATSSLPRGGGEGGGVGCVCEDKVETACCAALASMSHTIYASRMAAEGLFHLKHTYRFVLRARTACAAGEVLVGFADRYVPLESFGAKRNALRYKGCYYLSLQTGGLYAPSQAMCAEPYQGWRAAATAAAEQRWRRRGEDESRCRTQDNEGDVLNVPLSPCTSPSRRGAVQPECVVRAGDEVACVLRLDERSISFEWNGVDCGVAFTGVNFSPSLYPCVELNCSGGTVELL